jgi:hypothetical protein
VTALQHSADKELLADAKVEAAKVKLEGDLLLLKQQGVDKQAIERMHIEGLRSIAQLSASLKGSPKLAVGLQKSEDEDLAKINSGIAQQETFTKPLESLTIDQVFHYSN